MAPTRTESSLSPGTEMNNRFAFLPMRPSNDLLGDPSALRDRLDDDSYLLFTQVLDPHRLRQVRVGIQKVLAGHGWMERPSIPLSGRCLVAPLRETDEDYLRAYDDVQRLEELHALAHDPWLVETMRQVLGPTAFPHPLKIARIAFPDNVEASTPPHQDFPNNQGTPELTATWIPLMDIPPELGGLAVLRGSHRWGLMPLARHLGAGNRCSSIPPEVAESCRWVTTDFALGDVLVFPSLTVHAALHNASALDVRLSVDFRYQEEGAALTEGVLRPHFGRLGWDEVYEGWGSEELQYYWRDLDYEVVPFEDHPLTDHDGSREFTEAEMREIYDYQRRVEVRTARRLARLDGASGDGPGPPPA